MLIQTALFTHHVINSTYNNFPLNKNIIELLKNVNTLFISLKMFLNC